MARLAVMGIGVAGLLAFGALGVGCKTAKEEAKTFKRCGQGQRCKRPNVCIRVGRTSKTSRVLVLTLLSAVPVVGLIILGFYLKKKARKEAG